MDLRWIDYTRRSDPAQPYYAERLCQMLDEHGYPRVFCFWTKAPATVAQLYRDLIPEMQAQGTLVLAQVTLNGYGPELEPGITAERAELGPLVRLLGAGGVRLRLDPIIVGYTRPEHFERMLEIAQAHGVGHVTTNFLVPSYKGVGKLLQKRGFEVQEPSSQTKIVTLRWMVERAAGVGMVVAGCAELYREKLDADVPGLARVGCADPDWAAGLRPEYAGSFSLRPSRSGCLCVYSGDWGVYPSRGGPRCVHACLYCYAK